MKHSNQAIEKYRAVYIEHSIYGCRGEGNNGVFEVPKNEAPCGRALSIIASDGGGWDHVSVSGPSYTPNWQEMAFVKALFFTDDECVIQYHPPKKDHINYHQHCLHLWRPQKANMPMPPKEMIA